MSLLLKAKLGRPLTSLSHLWALTPSPTLSIASVGLGLHFPLIQMSLSRPFKKMGPGLRTQFGHTLFPILYPKALFPWLLRSSFNPNLLLPLLINLIWPLASLLYPTPTSTLKLVINIVAHCKTFGNNLLKKIKCNLMHLVDTKRLGRFCFKNKSDCYSKLLLKYLATKTIELS